MKVKLINLPHIGSEGTYFGIKFTAIGKAKVSADNTRFTGVTLVADVDGKLAASLIEADKLEELSDADFKALKAKAAKAAEK